MSKTKNKAAAKQLAKGAARKSSLSHPSRKLKIGDRVRIVDIAPNLKDPNYDSNLKSAELREMRTAELFRFCVGRVFKIHGFDRYGNVELHVSNSTEVRRKFGNLRHTIWSEPEFLKLVRASD
jgi:hypothetical protein